VSDNGPAEGPDGKLRCPWGLSAPEYLAYHDEEWGRPLHGDTAIFERLCLEGFQSGLSWLTILRKRENFRAAFAGFEPRAVAAFGEQDVARLMADAGIVRNRAKINAVITNARAALGLSDGLDALVWTYAGTPGPAPRTLADVPGSTPASKALSAELRRNGFTFTGPVTAYATMQACGIVNDHLAGCFCRAWPGITGRTVLPHATGKGAEPAERRVLGLSCSAWMLTTPASPTSPACSRRSPSRRPSPGC
jgi:DNA-3-methyladenine glycosylase I